MFFLSFINISTFCDCQEPTHVFHSLKYEGLTKSFVTIFKQTGLWVNVLYYMILEHTF